MDTLKHTPGPWYQCKVNPTNVAKGRYQGDGYMVATGMGLTHTSFGEAHANARLISAAPDLLVALQMAIRQNSHDMLLTGEELRECEAAIAKATGQS